MQGESGGVIGMLEVIQSDFARLESETSTAETTADAEYSEFMNASEVDRAQKQKDLDHKKSQTTLSEQTLTESQADLESTEKELESANRHSRSLRPTWSPRRKSWSR